MRHPALVLAVALFLILQSQGAHASGCPPGAADCFLCGGVDGIACSQECPSGPVREGIGAVACECPQGEPCVCYCPYAGGAPKVSDNIDPLLESAPPCQSLSPSCPDCGEASLVQGKVGLKRDGLWCLLQEGQTVGGGERVYVPEGSALRIRMFNGGVMDAAGGSVFDIERMSGTGKSAMGSFIMSLAKGAFHFLMDKDRIEQYEVRMDSAVVGIEGTEFLMGSDGSTITTKVLEGTVSLGSAGSSDTMELSEGQMASVPASGGPISGPSSFDIQAEHPWWDEEAGQACGGLFVLLSPLCLGMLRTRC